MATFTYCQCMNLAKTDSCSCSPATLDICISCFPPFGGPGCYKSLETLLVHVRSVSDSLLKRIPLSMRQLFVGGGAEQGSL